jgi:hypothetical protein
MSQRIVSAEELRKDFEIHIESVEGNSIEWKARINLVSHSGNGIASGVTIDIEVSARAGIANYSCKPASWGTKLTEMIPALNGLVADYSERQASGE